MATDPHTYEGKYNDLRITPTSDPGVIGVELFNRAERRGFWTEVPVGKIRSMIDACTTPVDDMDGGVTAALIEKEAEEPDLAVDYHAMWWKTEREREKAERERDEARGALRARLGVLAEPRPLTPDAGEAEPTDVWRRRAEKAEQERDEAIAFMTEAQEEATRQAVRADTAESRPLTPRQNLAALWESAHRPVGGRIPAGTAIITRSDYGSGDVRYQTLEATGRDLPDPGHTLERNYNYGPENGQEYRLLDPPTRPDWIDAPAVRAWHKNDLRTEHDGTPGKPRVWSPDYGTTETWSTPSLPHVPWSDLVDVEPLSAPEDGAA